MTTAFSKMYSDMITTMRVKGLRIPVAGVRFFHHDQEIPSAVMDNHPQELTLTCCQALKQALLGNAVCLTLQNIGCVAAAISLGLVDKDQDEPLGDSIVYTDVRR